MTSPHPTLAARLAALGHRAALAAAGPAGQVWRGITRHGMGVVGLAAVSVGAGQVYGPAGWIAAGVLLLADRAVDDHRKAAGGGG